MNEYHKINTLFKRNMAGDKKLIVGEWAAPEFEYLQNNTWEFTEKVDGTNIRVHFHRDEDTIDVAYYGRTDNASLPPHLMQVLYQQFGTFIWPGSQDRHPFLDNLGRMMLDKNITDLTLYGEGYGPKIQGGGKYRDTPGFVCFDIKVGDWWLERPTVESICEQLAVDIVPVVGYGTLHDAVNLASNGGLQSEWGNFISEGIVARPQVQLFNRKGERIIAKIKVRDFD